jgi:tRNA(fMet)-specific endonuclease VapC
MTIVGHQHVVNETFAAASINRYLATQRKEMGYIFIKLAYRAFHLAKLDQDAGERSGVIRADLESRGERIGAYDLLIAGIASARGHVLATHNVREFGRVAGLQIEDWAAIP